MRHSERKAKFNSIIQLRVSQRMGEALARTADMRDTTMSNLLREMITEITGYLDTWPRSLPDEFKPAA
jgi:hypothetical protein